MSQFHFLYHEAADLKPGREIQSLLITRKLARERRCISERYRLSLSSIDRKVTYHEGENNMQTPGLEIIAALYQNYFKINQDGLCEQDRFP